MNLPFIFHSQTIDGLAFNQEQVTVRLKTETLDFDSVYVRLEPDNEECLVDMTQVGTAGELLLWEAPTRITLFTPYSAISSCT